MNVRGVGIQPQMGGVGHVVQASEKKQEEPQAGEHVVRPGDKEQEQPETPGPER